MKRAVVVLLGLVALVHFGSATAAGNVEQGKAKAGVCAGCHGVDGNSMNPEWPKLAGQHDVYIAKQLADFKSGARSNALMAGQVAALTNKDMQNLGAYFASLKSNGGAAATKEAADRGARLYRGGNSKSGVASCMGCHGPAGQGISPNFPRLSGQHAKYTVTQLLAFKAGKRSNDGKVMTQIAFRMSEQEINDVAEYIAGLH